MLVSNLNKLRQLPKEDRIWLFQATLLLPLIHLALLSVGYYRLRRWMERSSPLQIVDASENEIPQRAEALARIVEIAAKHGIYRATCLRRSLLLWWFLRRAGIPSQLRFGVRRQCDRLEAHAWVECHGIVVNDSAAVHENYQTLDGVLPSTHFGL
jgi:Transglutaminase-like superfamily